MLEVENLMMKHSSSEPPKFDADQIGKSPRGSNGAADSNDANEASSQRMVADRLLAALSGGNLEHLAKARQAFLKQDSADSRQDDVATKQRPANVREFPADLAAQVEGQARRTDGGRW
jgi:hypothetical protein